MKFATIFPCLSLFLCFVAHTQFSSKYSNFTLSLALVPVRAECVLVAMAWEVAGESQAAADARSPPRWLTGG